ncbi:MAG: porin, partial [Planctomycetes bacterium]|nr:porin [Planctomycetota bacterium]
GAVNYFIYKHTDKITSTIRAEVFDDNQGVRTGFAGLYTEVTYGVAWQPKPGIIIRPSVRYDNNSTSAPFDGKHDMWTGAFEMIFRW